jgi:methylated-DNA-[protein]-cysteine S-methyltransferase
MTLVATASGLAGAWFEGQRHHPGLLSLPNDPRQRWLALAASEFNAYWNARGLAMSPEGQIHGFSVPLALAGTPFQLQVWQALLGIGPGCTRRYGELAAFLGRPLAARAVGAAVGRNPVSIMVPCHRVLGAGGALTGYAGGIHRKQALLSHEGVTLPSPPPADRKALATD